MEIRKAKKEDLEGVEKLLIQVNQIHYEGRSDLFKQTSKYTFEELEDLIQNPLSLILVAIKEKKVVGYAISFIKEEKNNPLLQDIKNLYIDDICVDVNNRRQNIGESLFHAIIELAKKEKFYHVTLNVWEFNKAAKAFYQKMGMIPLKTIMEYKL